MAEREKRRDKAARWPGVLQRASARVEPSRFEINAAEQTHRTLSFAPFANPARYIHSPGLSSSFKSAFLLGVKGASEKERDREREREKKNDASAPANAFP